MRPAAAHEAAASRHFARLVCLLFAIVGFIPVGGALVLRSTWARQIASRETTRIVRDKGFEASYEVGIRLWPLSVVLTSGSSPTLPTNITLFTIIRGF